MGGDTELSAHDRGLATQVAFMALLTLVSDTQTAHPHSQLERKMRKHLQSSDVTPHNSIEGAPKACLLHPRLYIGSISCRGSHRDLDAEARPQASIWHKTCFEDLPGNQNKQARLPTPNLIKINGLKSNPNPSRKPQTATTAHPLSLIDLGTLFLFICWWSFDQHCSADRPRESMWVPGPGCCRNFQTQPVCCLVQTVNLIKHKPVFWKYK